MGRKKKLTKEQKEKIIELVEAGETLEAIGSKFDRSRQAMSKNLQRWGVEIPAKKRMGAPKKLSDEQQAQLIIDYKTRVPISEILKKYKITNTTLFNYLSDLNIPKHRYAKRRDNENPSTVCIGFYITVEAKEYLEEQKEPPESINQCARRLAFQGMETPEQ